MAFMAKQKETLAERLKRSRDEANMTQEQLGTAIGVTAAAIGLIEIGDTKSIRSQHLFTLARALNKNPEWLATGKGPEHPTSELDTINAALHAKEKLKVLEFFEYVITTAPALTTTTERGEYINKIHQLMDDAKHDQDPDSR